MTFIAKADNRRGTHTTLVVVVFMALVVVSIGTFAQSTPFNILDQIDARFRPLQQSWGDAIRGYANRLFWLLVAVDFAWTGVVYVLEKNEISEIVVSLVKKIFTIGFFFSVLKFSDTWVPAIIDSFRQIGTSVGNISSTTPDGIAWIGFDLAMSAFKSMHKLNTIEMIVIVFPVTLIALVIVLSFLFVAAQLLVTLIESYICIGAGVILLGFGGSRWTTDFATKYLQYAVGTGIKLMLLYLVIGAGQTITDALLIDPEHLVESTLAAMGVSLVYGYLAIQIPSIANAMISGSPSLTAGAMATSALTMGAAIAGVGGLGASAAAAGLGATGDAAAGAGGLAKALGAGLDSAHDIEKKGGSAVTHAAGEVISHGMSMAGDRIGDLVSGGGPFAEKISNSVGGKIASRIEAKAGGTMRTADSGISSKPENSGSSSPSTEGLSRPTAAVTEYSSETPLGDASGASISPGESRATSSSGSRDGDAPLHEKIRNLQGFVPHDLAGGGGNISIDLKHTQD